MGDEILAQQHKYDMARRVGGAVVHTHEAKLGHDHPDAEMLRNTVRRPRVRGPTRRSARVGNPACDISVDSTTRLWRVTGSRARVEAVHSTAEAHKEVVRFMNSLNTDVVIIRV